MVGTGGQTQPALFAAPTPPAATTTKTRRRQPLNAWAHTTTTGQCPTCGKPTLNALEDTRTLIPNTADPHTLTSTDELTALLAGRHTYDYDTRNRTLQRRTIHHIRGHPPEHDTHPVVPQHHCTNTLGTPLPPTPPTKETSTNDTPPF
ncbi:hypothetical protein [Arthrobacter agilis]|uniref:hypothetical protein n=1 Tax=Arthrobacter agilis TaxID=37921 RepID=UPI0027803F2D|nr:hypothetical protein [Arthrobacter agilis]MDQ0735313.1 hypothetical protein [Arthrobacter agilis]